jgi:hypothetical protein
LYRLRGGLYVWRAIAADGHKVCAALDDIKCEITNSTTDAELEGFIQKFVRAKVIRPKENFFRKKGRLWVFAYQGTEGYVADLVGVRCIVILLYHPGELIHASRLLALAYSWDVAPEAQIYGEMSRDQLEGEGLSPHDQPFADRPFVEETLKSYQEAQKALESQLFDAIKQNDEKLQLDLNDKIAAIKAGLASLTWKGKAVHPSMREEKDRKRVWSDIQRAIPTISKENASLGQHLKAHINTGEFCSYTPGGPITWE